MAIYINTITNEYPIYTGDMQLIFADFNDTTVPEGYALVPHLDAPEHTDTQRIQELLPILTDGVWVKQFQIIELTAEELLERARLNAELENQNKPPAQNLNISGSAPNVIG